MNYGVPQNQWLAASEVDLVEAPFLTDMELRHSAHRRNTDPPTLVLTVTEQLLASAPRAP